LHQDFVRVVTDLQAGVGEPANTARGGIEGELTRLFAIRMRNLDLAGAVLGGYAVVEGVEAVGLWRARRWAEYLTFAATALLVPLEIYEISHKPTALKVLTLAVNLAIAGYLVLAKRLFGLRGGWRAERSLAQAGSGWAALERATPARPGGLPGAKVRAPARGPPWYGDRLQTQPCTAAATRPEHRSPTPDRNREQRMTQGLTYQ
jgi:uncharacterized membrane protein (DUF2068 family)